MRLVSRYNSEEVLFAAAGVVAFALIIAYWLGLWGVIVKWNAFRLVLTLASIPAAGLAGLVAYAVVCGMGSGYGGDRGFAAFLGSSATPLLWLVATILIWRETAAERAARVRGAARGGVACPTCGYNLTGLTTTRCPECGTQFTLDELFAQQGGKYAGDLAGD
jgi:hypothetical protein